MGPRRDAAPALLAFQLQTSVSNGLLQTCSSETAPTFLCAVTAEHTTETSQQHSSRVTLHTRELHPWWWRCNIYCLPCQLHSLLLVLHPQTPFCQGYLRNPVVHGYSQPKCCLFMQKDTQVHSAFFVSTSAFHSQMNHFVATSQAALGTTATFIRTT